MLSTYRRRIALLKPKPFQSQTAHTKHPSDARRCCIHVHDVDHFNRDPLVRDCSRWDHRRYLFQQRRPRTNSHVASKYERASLILIISLRHCGTTYLFLKLIAADAIVVWRMLVLYPNKVVRVGILFLLFSFSSTPVQNLFRPSCTNQSIPPSPRPVQQHRRTRGRAF